MFLQDKTIFMASIFIPLIYIVLFMVGEEWQNNDYFLFADIEEFNTKAKKLFKTLVKKTEVLKNKYKKNRRKGRNKVEEEEMHETTANIIRVSLVKYAPAETDNIPKGIEAS